MPGVLSRLLNVLEDETCEIGHTWDRGCYSSAAGVFFDILRVCPSIYLPLYLANMIIRRKGLSHLPRVLSDSLRSSGFLALNGFGFVSFFCLLTKLSGGVHILSGGVPGFCGGFLAILTERKSRRAALALYVGQLAVQLVFHQLQFRGYVSGIPRGEVLVFSITTAALMYLYRHYEGARSGLVGSVLRFLLWDNQTRPEGLESHHPRSQYQVILHRIAETYKRYTAVVQASLPRHPASVPLCHSLQVAVRGFLLGYGAQTAIGLLTSLPQILRNKSLLLRVLFSNNSAMFGLFIGGFVGLYKALLVVLQRMRGEDGAINTAVAGGLSGLSMLFYQSTPWAMNLASKVAEMVYVELHRAGRAPHFYYFDCLLYAVSFGLLSHGATLEPHNLKKSYYKFLLHITAGKWGLMNHFALDVLGTNASRLKRLGKMPVR